MKFLGFTKRNNFYLALLLTLWTVVIICIPPYHWHNEIPLGIIALLFLEITVYRYYDWKPEKSPLFELVMLSVIKNLLEKDMIITTHKNGKNKQTYKLSVKKIKEPTDENSKDNEAN